jgi:hypothetical protein
MSQPVKLSDALVLDARLAAELQERSIAGQVEYWAKLGQAIDGLLNGVQAMALRRAGGIRPLSELVAEVGTPAGHEKLHAYLESEPFPHFEVHPTQAGFLIRIEEDGRRTVGRFVDRQFVVDSVLSDAVLVA